MGPMDWTTAGGKRFLLVLGLVAGLGLACGTPQADRQALLQSRREAEFAELSRQAGMVTPSYLQAKEANPPAIHP